MATRLLRLRVFNEKIARCGSLSRSLLLVKWHTANRRVTHCESTGGNLLLVKWHSANRRVGACHSSSGTVRNASCDITRFMQRTSWIKAVATRRTLFHSRILIVRKSFSAHAAHHCIFFILVCRSKRMIFKFIMAFIASVKFLAHRAFIRNYVQH